MFNNPDWSSKNIVTNYNDLAQRSFLKSYYWHSLISLIRSNTFNNPESNILEIGCGPGWISIISKFLSPNCNYYSIDLSSEMINTDKSNATEHGINDIYFSVVNAESLPYSDNSFDLVTSYGVLRLLNNPSKVLKESYRVLKPGGYLYFSDVGNVSSSYQMELMNQIEDSRDKEIMRAAMASALSKDQIYNILKETTIDGWKFYIGNSTDSSEVLKWIRYGYPINKLNSIPSPPQWSVDLSKKWNYITIFK